MKTRVAHASARTTLRVVTNIRNLAPGRGAGFSLQRDFSPAKSTIYKVVFGGAGTTLRVVANVSRTEPEVARKYGETRLGS